MEPPKHEIKTLEDILRAVNMTNIEFFLKDFDSFLRMWTATKMLAEIGAPATSVEQIIKSVKFTWIDDGKHDARVDIQVNQVDEKVEKTAKT